VDCGRQGQTAQRGQRVPRVRVRLATCSHALCPGLPPPTRNMCRTPLLLVLHWPPFLLLDCLPWRGVQGPRTAVWYPVPSSLSSSCAAVRDCCGAQPVVGGNLSAHGEWCELTVALRRGLQV
jgi:hypothetical protein